MCAVADMRWIRKNDGDVVQRPYREAVGLVSRRLADFVEGPDGDADDGGVVHLDRDLKPYADAYSKDELVKLAEDNDLPVSGNKLDLVERLLDADVELSTGDDTSSGATPGNVPVESEETSTGGRD